MTLENEQIIRQAYAGKPQGRLDGPQIHRRHRALRAPGPARERVCMAALRAALHKQDGEPMRLTRTVCPGALSPARVAAQSRATAKGWPESGHSRLSVVDRFCCAPVARITVIR